MGARELSTHRGISLPSVLLLVTIVMMVAATMAGVFTINMNITQRVSNGSMALAEAEAGLSEVLYHITREENIEGDKDAKTPKITWGRNGETIRATISPGMSPEEAYHVVTFDQSSNFPYSTNNTYLDRDSGDLGRTVPDGMIHVLSTGYCKGQYRTVEALIERPPFPFGLATSGPIRSPDPIVVTGVSNLAKYISGEEDRPGHILCNSPEGITIGAAPQGVDASTKISGFVKSVGPVSIEQPAVVRGGIRSFADPSTITNIQVSDFQLAGEPGVVTLLDDRYDQAQELDVMYHYGGGGHLQYMSNVRLNNAMVYVEGDLTVHGPVSGEGLLVVDGNATFKSGSALAGSNKMAVICSGDVTIEGNANYFTGLVYCEGNLNASNVTILGNAVVNSDDPAKGGATLRNVKFVSNEETADMSITITSSSQATASGNQGNGSMPNVFVGQDGFGHVDTGDGWISGNISDDDINWIAGHQLMDGLLGPAFSPGGTEPVPPMVYPPGGVGDAGHIWAMAEGLRGLAEQAQAERMQTESEIQALEDQLDSVTGDDEDAEDLRDHYRSQISQKQSELDDYQAQIEAEFQQSARDMLREMRSWSATHTDAGGTLESSITDMDIEIDKDFNLNRYLPQSERVKVSYWKVHPRRL